MKQINGTYYGSTRFVYEEIRVRLCRLVPACYACCKLRGPTIFRLLDAWVVIENLQTGQGDGVPLLLEFTVAHSPTWSDQHKVTGLGDIDGVLVKNIRVLSGLKTPRIAIQGSVETRSGYPASPHKITNVSLENILLQEEKLTSDYPAFSLAYAEGITLDGVTIS